MKYHMLNPSDVVYFLETKSIFQENDGTNIIHGTKSMWVSTPIDTIVKSWRDWTDNGMLIQDAFRYLDADEREFLITGLLPAEWDEMFDTTEDE